MYTYNKKRNESITIWIKETCQLSDNNRTSLDHLSVYIMRMYVCTQTHTINCTRTWLDFKVNNNWVSLAFGFRHMWATIISILRYLSEFFVNPLNDVFQVGLNLIFMFVFIYLIFRISTSKFNKERNNNLSF